MKRTELEADVLKEIRPTEEELTQSYALADRLIRDIKASGKADGMLVGSLARRTCIRGDRDIDVFMLFDPSLSREDLKTLGLKLAYQVLAQYTEKVVEKYAEHPYLNAEIDGLDVDLVPCYKVEKATSIQSAVDRTPFHNLYISSRIPPFTDDVLLLKQFVKAGGVYGSDQMTEGFAGYLCELLVLHYGGFSNLIHAGAKWNLGLLIDIAHHQEKQFDDPMVVIDPVDPCRNVSASVSDTKMLEFIELCRGYLESPSQWFFYRPPTFVLTHEEVKKLLAGRESAILAITFQTPPLIEDIIVPQLRKSLTSISDLLTRHEFVIERTDYKMCEERSMLIFEFIVDTLPAIKYHKGPPVISPINSSKFIQKYLYSDEIFAGPYIRDGRYGVELNRRYRTAYDLLKSKEVNGAAHGKHIKMILQEGYVVHRGIECWQPGFEIFISEFLQKASPLVRIRRAEKKA